MTEDVRITAVESDRVSGGWTVRGHVLGEPSNTFRYVTVTRGIAASCLGSKILRWPVAITRDDKNYITAVSVI